MADYTEQIAPIVAECEAKVDSALRDELASIWQSYYDGNEDASTAWDAWEEQLRKESYYVVPAVVANVVSHFMCGDIDLYYKPTPLYKAVCIELNKKADVWVEEYLRRM